MVNNAINSMCLSASAKGCEVAPYTLYMKELAIAILIINCHQLKGRRKKGLTGTSLGKALLVIFTSALIKS